MRKKDKHTAPPVTTDDDTDSDREPEYDPPIRQTPAPSQDNPTDSSGTVTPSGNTASDDSHPGQVYDPVFGWIDVGTPSRTISTATAT